MKINKINNFEEVLKYQKKETFSTLYELKEKDYQFINEQSKIKNINDKNLKALIILKIINEEKIELYHNFDFIEENKKFYNKNEFSKIIINKFDFFKEDIFISNNKDKIKLNIKNFNIYIIY